jgi:hypothetical protein
MERNWGREISRMKPQSRDIPETQKYLLPFSPYEMWLSHSETCCLGSLWSHCFLKTLTFQPQPRLSTGFGGTTLWQVRKGEPPQEAFQKGSGRGSWPGPSQVQRGLWSTWRNRNFCHAAAEWLNLNSGWDWLWCQCCNGSISFQLTCYVRKCPSKSK